MASPSGAGQDPRSENLVSEARGGDRHAFDALYARIAPALYAWCCLRIHPSLRGRLDPEDLVQEVWWRALDGFAGFDRQRGAFRTWVFQIAKNTLLNAFRHLRVRGDLAASEGPRRLPEIPSELAADATSVSRAAARAEDARHLLDAVLQLPDEDRTLVACCALEGLSAPEAAAILGISPAAAAKRWARLKELLRTRLPGLSE